MYSMLAAGLTKLTFFFPVIIFIAVLLLITSAVDIIASVCLVHGVRTVKS